MKPSPETVRNISTKATGRLLPRTRLRTRFLLSMVLITAGLTTTSLLLVRRSVESHFRQSMAVSLRNSVAAFQDFRHERETMLTSNVALLADLPITRAIMTGPDPVTIQDASQDVYEIADSDLFVLVDRGGKVVALHTKTPGFTRDAAEKYFQQALGEDRDEPSHWWLGEHHLYQTFIEPIYRGSRTEGTLLGFLVIGYEIDHRLAAEVSKVAGSQVAFSYGNEIVATTLPQDLAQRGNIQSLITGSVQEEPHDVFVGRERFLATSLELSGSPAAPVRLSVLGSYEQTKRFLDELNRYLILLGVAAVLIGSGLVFFLSHTFTRPLASLVSGVRALEEGDFHHPLDSRGSDEVAELTRAFDRMRTSLLKSQRDLLESEQLATIGRMASSISHDLRHSLAAIVANSEFLCDSHLTPGAARGTVSGGTDGRESDDGPDRLPAGIRPHPRIADCGARQCGGEHSAGGAGGAAASTAPCAVDRCDVRAAGFGMVRSAQAGACALQPAAECVRGGAGGGGKSRSYSQ